MTTRKQTMKHLPLIATVTLISAVFGSGAYWGSALFRTQAGPVTVAPHTAPAPPDIAAAAGLFGGTPAAAASIAFKLKGVIEDGPEGVAILVEDGKPALAVGIGQEAAPGTRVVEIHRRYVLLDVAGTSTRLDLPDSGGSGQEVVAAAPATQPTPAMPATPSPAPMAAASAAATPLPVVRPVAAKPPGLTNDQLRQQYEERRRQEVERMERARQAAGMAPPSSGPQPAT
jgi:general secretion pathway protein C